LQGKAGKAGLTSEAGAQRIFSIFHAPTRLPGGLGADVRMPLRTPAVMAQQGSFDSICHALRARQILLKMTNLKKVIQI
jgi:hypothetical protein